MIPRARRREKDVIHDLESKRNSLQRQFMRLEEEQLMLKNKQVVMAQISDALAWMLSRHTAGLQASTAEQQEQQQQQYQEQSEPSGDTGSSDRQLAWELVSPADDPLSLLRWLLTQPLWTVPPGFSLQSLVLDYAQSVRELALQLQLHDSMQASLAAGVEPPPMDPSPAQRIKAIIQRYLWILLGLSLQQRTDMIHSFVLINTQTGTAMPEVDSARHLWAVSSIGLSQQQLQHMASCCMVYKSLLGAVLQSVAELQQQLGSGDSDSSDSSDSAADSSGCAAACPGSSSSSSRFGATSGGSGSSGDALLQQIEASQIQQRKARHLNMLLHKDFMLKQCAVAHLFGCLTWPQLGRLFVLLTPQPLAVAGLVSAVLQLWQRQQQGRHRQVLQQQQKARSNKHRQSTKPASKEQKQQQQHQQQAEDEEDNGDDDDDDEEEGAGQEGVEEAKGDGTK